MSRLWIQFTGELRKLFARKRTNLGFAAFVFVELFVAMLFELKAVQAGLRVVIEGTGHKFDDYFSGLTLAFLILDYTVILIGALYIAMVAGDIVAKEVEDGTMRMLLCRPASRLRILALKFLATSFYTFALVVFIGLSSLAVGLALEGVGGLFAFAPLEELRAFHPFPAGVWIYFRSLPFFAVSLLTINAVAFLFSCLDVKPVAATIGTLTIFFLDLVLRSHPFFQSVHPYFITSRMGIWVHTFRPDPQWAVIAEEYVRLLALDATLFLIAWASFEQRDIKT